MDPYNGDQAPYMNNRWPENWNGQAGSIQGYMDSIPRLASRAVSISAGGAPDAAGAYPINPRGFSLGGYGKQLAQDLPVNPQMRAPSQGLTGLGLSKPHLGLRSLMGGV